jgi:lysophospholipid acyltransferase (LPLAT)-like uncharacterized protein
MRFVWSTSRIEPNDFRDLEKIRVENDGVVALLFHEEVFTVGFAYPFLGFRPHTLASLGNAGEVASSALHRCGYQVFRGGSTTHRSRRRRGVVDEMIEHMRSHRGVLYGLTVDGSHGPAYRMRKGGIVIARECAKPVVLVRTWTKRCLRLPTWDRTAIPLPFNRIAYYLKGPYCVPEDARGRAGLNRFRDRLEDDLIDLAARSYDDMGQARPSALLKRRRGPD